MNLPGKSCALAVFVASTLAAPANAQSPLRQRAASSTNAFLVTGSVSAGGAASSGAHHFVGGFVGIAGHATSSSYALDVHWAAGRRASSLGRPWATAIAPLFAPLGVGSAHTVFGTELHLGSQAQAFVGGAPGTIVRRTRSELRLTSRRSALPVGVRLS